ncbi:MAG: helix-turn-helix transcriptional regulator [Chloroflexi bacterium]|nr:helix-turn-helix transcriptional regulator [Chloroflexota bacterium]
MGVRRRGEDGDCHCWPINDRELCSVTKIAQPHLKRLCGTADARPRQSSTPNFKCRGDEHRDWWQAAGRLKRGGLTLRQLEVLRLIALGKTNKDIAGDLFLSPRTVDMHVGNIFTRLDSRSRTDAVRKAGELGLLEGSTQ